MSIGIGLLLAVVAFFLVAFPILDRVFAKLAQRKLRRAAEELESQS